MRTLLHVPAALLLSTCAWVSHAGNLQVTVLDKDGKPAPDAVVIVIPAGKGVAKNPPPMQAVVNQEKMQFIPAVTVVAQGARIRMVNNDPWDHHVRMSPPGLAQVGTEGYTFRLEGKTEGKPPKSVDVVMDKPGASGATLLGCFIHGSMSGHVFVADSPWTEKTDANGQVSIEDLPQGAAKILVWHAVQPVPVAPQNLVITATPVKVTLQLDVVLRKRRS